MDVATADEPAPPGAPTGAARIALVVAVAHGLNDAYSAFVPPLLPRLMDRLGLSIALAATLAMAFSIAGSILQPLMGWLADRYGRRAFVVVGPVASAVFISLMGLAPSFAVLLLFLTLAGLGSAAFHPPGASYAARVADGGRSGARMSIFSFGGTVGFAAGPLIAVALVQRGGVEGLWVAMLPALVIMPLVYLNLPSGRREAAVAAHPPPHPREVIRHLAGPLGLLFGVSALMAFNNRIFVTLEPIIVAQAGGSETLGAVALTVYLGAQAAGTLSGGYLADVMDRRHLLAGLCALAVPAHMAAVGLAPGSAAALAAAGVAGFAGMATLPPIVVVAQEILPRGAGVSSGVVMGLAWATGSLGVMGVGVLADRVGPVVAALWTLPAGLLAIVLALRPALAIAARPRGA